jgi:hypothetical protein
MSFFEKIPILNRFFSKKVEPAIPSEMSEQEKNVIKLFAIGAQPLRQSAINIHRKYLHNLNTPEQLFMREVDNPCPDLNLRAQYRRLLCNNTCEIKKG